MKKSLRIQSVFVIFFGGWLTDYMGFRFMFLWDFILTLLGALLLLKGKKALHTNI